MKPLTKAERALVEQASPDSMLQNRRLRALFYGDFSSGKTDLALRILDSIGFRRCGFFTSDSAWTTAHKYPDIVAKLDRFNFEGTSQIELFIKARAEGIEPYASWDAVLWDTISTSSDVVLDNLTDAHPFNDQIHPESPGWTHYNITTRRIKSAIDTLKATDLHVIYTAHVRYPSAQEKKDSKLLIRPNLPEQSYRAVAQEVQLIGHLFKNRQGGRRMVQVEATNTVTAKTVLSTVPEGTYKSDDLPRLIAEWTNG